MTLRISPVKCPDCQKNTDLMIKGRTFVDITTENAVRLHFLESCMHCGRYYSAVLDLSAKVEVMSFANQKGVETYGDD